MKPMNRDLPGIRIKVFQSLKHGGELYEGNQIETIQGACKASMFGHTQTLEADIAVGKKLYVPKAKLTAASLALYTQVYIQGASILAKASGEVKNAVLVIEHLENNVRLLFPR